MYSNARLLKLNQQTKVKKCSRARTRAMTLCLWTNNARKPKAELFFFSSCLKYWLLQSTRMNIAHRLIKLYCQASCWWQLSTNNWTVYFKWIGNPSITVVCRTPRAMLLWFAPASFGLPTNLQMVILIYCKYLLYFDVVLQNRCLRDISAFVSIPRHFLLYNWTAMTWFIHNTRMLRMLRMYIRRIYRLSNTVCIVFVFTMSLM